MTMQKTFFHRITLVVSAIAVFTTASTLPARAGVARADGDDDDRMNVVVQPADVTKLDGKEMSYDKRSGYVTIGRPQDNADKMFLLYNVGQKKFLNVGSYWGTHAALSTVPRPFWFQRRNEVAVSPMWGYLRYPENPGESIGYFAKDFFALKTLQIGSLERSKQKDGSTDKTVGPHVTYNYIRYYASADDQNPKDIVTPGFKATGNDWVQSLQSVSFATGGRIEAQIDLTDCQGDGSSSDGKTHMETVLSIGSNIKYWDLDGFLQNNLHIYAFRQNGQSYIRVMAVDADYKDSTHKSGGQPTENPITVGSDNIITVIVENGSIRVKTSAADHNDVDCMPRNRNNLTSPIAPLFALSSLSAGSMEGTTRTNALVNYIKLTSSKEQATEDSCVVKPGTHYTSDQKFYREYSGGLKQWQVNATLDLTTCKGNNEDVLSIGTDIATWNNGQNLHIYYMGDDKLEITAANTNNKVSGWVVKDPHNVSVALTPDGLFVDGQAVTGNKGKFDADNDAVIANLLNTAEKLQVGSAMGKDFSHATYRRITVTKALRSFPDATEAWDGRKFMKSLDKGLRYWEISATLDLSTCIGSGKNSNENVLSIGTDIAKWANGSSNIHIYYTPGTKTLEFDAVNNTNHGDQYRVKKVLTDEELKNVNIKLTTEGLYFNGTLVAASDGSRAYDSSNPIIQTLLTATGLQIGSKEGEPSHALYKDFTFTSVTPPTFPTAGQTWDGTTTFSKTVSGNLAAGDIEATIDLSTCTGTKENVISIGSDIQSWGNGSDAADHANNIHFYYTKGESKVYLDVACYDWNGTVKTGNYEQFQPAVTDNKLVVKVTSEGIWVNDTQIADAQKKGGNAGVLAHVLEYLSQTATEMQIGSLQGSSRSRATYTSLTVDGTSILEAASASAKTALTAADGDDTESGTTEGETTTTTSPVTASLMSAAEEYVPVYNLQGNGRTAFGTENYNIDLTADGDGAVEAQVDLSKATTINENVLSIGNNIATWMKGQDGTCYTNLHLYYAGQNADGEYTLSIAYTDKDNNDGLRRAFAVKAAADGSALATIKLAKGKLTINGHEPYTLTDTIPAILYDEVTGGDIVRFKTADDGSFVHDSNGRLIEVKKGEEGFDTAKPIKVSLAKSYLYTDDLQEGVLPLFISSRFRQETTSNGNEGQYFSWSPYLPNNNKWGTVGVFADRALPQKEITNTQSLNCSQWFVEPYTGTVVAGEEGKKLYRIYLKMSDVEKPVRKGVGNYDFETQAGQQRYYLQATDEYVYGDNLEEYYNETDVTKRDFTFVEALNNGGDDGSALGDDLNSVWKIIDLNEYHRLFETEKSEMTTMLDLSYMLSDPSFSRENYEVTGWKIDSTLKGHIRMGYDYFSKKWTDDTDYTDEHSRKTVKNSSGAITSHASAQHEDISAHTNNHARYMGLDVRGENAGGNIRQDVTVTNPGWYAFSCYGFSNIGASLFVQVVNGTGDNATVSSPVEQPLPTLTDELLKFFNDPTSVTANVGWPYHTGSSYHMPMYNALVSLNDHNVGDGTVPDKFYTQVAFFVDPDVLNDNNGELTLRFGLKVPSTSSSSDTGLQALADDTPDGSTAYDEDYTIGENEKWTVVDDFRLLFGGLAEEPNLVLDQDSTTLGYLDRSLHVFDLRPMRLHRTFSGGQWNTIILPVNLSKGQFETAFGPTAKLAQLDHLTSNTIEFVSAKESGDVLLQAYKPYIIWVDADHAKGNGKDNDGQEYVANLSQRSNSSKFESVKIGGDHFYIENVSLQGKHYDTGKQQYYYSFAEDTGKEQDITFDGATAHTSGDLFAYKDDTQAKLKDGDTGEGSLGLTDLRAYGTLCKTYGLDKTSGKNAILPDRPTLGGAFVFQKSNMYKVKSQYGTLGFRCWFASDDPTAQISSGAKVVIDGVEDGPTAIADVFADTGEPVNPRFSDGIFTIDGRKVAEGKTPGSLPAGIYIVNGHKVAVGK